MISRDEVSAMLRAACPSFAPNDLAEDDGTRLHYVEAGQFAAHLVGLMRRGHDEQIRRAFEVIETLHVEGDAYVRELASIGFLEAVQNHAGHASDVSPDDFLPYLGPETHQWWRQLDAFWSGDSDAPR